MKLRWILLCGLLSFQPVLAANHFVSVSSNNFSPEDLTIDVGDTVTFTNSGGGLHNAASDPGAPNGFRCANGCDGFGGDGGPSASNWTAVVLFSNPGLTRYHCEIHGGPGGSGMSGTISVQGAATPAPAARDDLVRLRMNSVPVDIAVLANDVFTASTLAGGTLTITQAPAAGTATVQTSGTSGTVADDFVRYTVPVDAKADVSLVYRVCDSSARCDDGQVRVLARALVDDELALDVASDAGFRDLALANLPPLPEAAYDTTLLVAPTVTLPVIPADATPATPWDNGRAGTALTTGQIPVPGDGLPQDWAVVVDAKPVGSGNLDLFVGRDLNNDGLPSENELQCTSAMSTDVERCQLALTHPGTGQVGYWVMSQNRGTGALSGQVEVAQLRLQAASGTVVATGPGHLDADATFPMRVGWNDPGLLVGDVRLGFVAVRPSPGNDFGWVPVRLDRVAGDPAPIALASGVDQILRLATNGSHERMFIDVPPGATSLTVTTASTSNVDLYLAKPAVASSPDIDAAPPRGSAAASGTGVTGNENLVLQGATLTPGRWYVTPVNSGVSSASVTVRATVAGTAPIVRSGSYYNAARSGHGVFVYPAGNQLVIIWYTYFQNGTPTWYYLQGLQPGANGSWAGTLFRSAWDGNSNVLKAVGRATLVPSGADAFTWSYSIDGLTGSEPFAALGRGCPSFNSVTRDASSHWYDPLTAGTGYSVQLFANYEFYASFVYDGQGTPRFLVAERPGVGNPTHTLVLEQLTGFCPTCNRVGNPIRQSIGDFIRTYSGTGQLTGIELDGDFSGAVPGAWSGDDAVQPLGGTISLQGCDL